MRRVLLATSNAHKVQELRAMLGHNVQVITPDSLGLQLDVDETGDSFAANATLKAEAYCAASAELCIADDSGLCVDALDGAPGIHSARFAAMAGAGEGDAANRALLLRRLDAVADADRGARFCSAVAIAEPGTATQVFHGESAGKIIFAERGDGGFGYDALFESFDQKTFAELSGAEKQARSHRGRAMQAAMPHLHARLQLAE